MFSLICARINVWVTNGKAGDLRRHCAHYDVTIMVSSYKSTQLFGASYTWCTLPASSTILCRPTICTWPAEAHPYLSKFLNISVILAQQLFIHPPQSTCCSRCAIHAAHNNCAPGNVVGFLRSNTILTSLRLSRLPSNLVHLSMSSSTTKSWSNVAHSACDLSRVTGARFR